MTATEEPRRRGPKSEFGPKEKPTVSVSLTALAKRILAAARRRKRTSASNVVEELLRKHGGTI